jgi:hypothetical protein
MLDLDGYRIISVCTDPGEPEPYCVVYAGGDSLYLGDICSEPDLTDPATLGCLLALVREATGDREAHTVPGVLRGWRCVVGGIASVVAPTEAAALVAALEAAP